MNIFLRIVAVVFFLIGLLAGGCSAFFTSMAFDGGVAVFWFAGIGVAILFIWAAIAIWRSQE